MSFLTGGIESGLWATPAAADGVGSHGGGQGRSLRTDIHNWKKGLWPTPNTSPTRPNEGNVRLLRAKVEAGEITEAEAKQMLNGKSPFEAQGKLPRVSATPSANEDAAGTVTGKMQKMLTHQAKESDPEGTATGGQLNPMWVEWLMGFPTGWTALEGWATPSSPKSRKSSSKPSKRTRKTDEDL